MIHLASSLTKQQYPTLKELQEAAVKADNPDFNSRDSRDLMSIAKRISNISPRLKGLINTRKTGIFAYRYDLRDNKKGDFTEIKLRLDKSLKKALLAPVYKNLFGDYLAEIVPDNTTAGFSLKEIEQTRYEPISETKFKLFAEDNLSFSIVDTIETPRKYLYLTTDTTNRGGQIRTVLDLEIRRYDNIREWSLFNERAKGQILGKIASAQLAEIQRSFGADKVDISKNVQELNNILENIGKNQYGILTDAYDVELKSLIEASANPTFVNLNKDLDEAISIAVLGQANTTQLPNSGGSRAALQVLNEIKSDIIWADMNEAEECANFILNIDYNLNKDRNGVAPYFFEFIYDDVKDIETQSVVLSNLASAIPNLQVISQEIYDLVGLTKPDGVPDVIELGQTSIPL